MSAARSAWRAEPRLSTGRGRHGRLRRHARIAVGINLGSAPDRLGRLLGHGRTLRLRRRRTWPRRSPIARRHLDDGRRRPLARLQGAGAQTDQGQRRKRQESSQALHVFKHFAQVLNISDRRSRS
ncbi:MAG: hypothetical protein MZV65_23565 [Chromatiales bacterium]|nr:hypothetical protein [Chromatiales bacterium]